MAETYRDIILRAILKVDGNRVAPPDTAPATKALDAFERRLNELSKSSAAHVSTLTASATKAFTDEAAKLERTAGSLAGRYDLVNREMRQLAAIESEAAENARHLADAQAIANKEFSRTIDRKRESAEATRAETAAAEALAKREAEILAMRKRLRAGPQPDDPSGFPDPISGGRRAAEAVDRQTERVTKLSARLRGLRGAYTAVQTSIPAFILATDQSASGTQRAAAATFGFLSAAQGLTSALGPLGLVALPVVAGATAAYALHQQRLNEQLERAARHESELERITDRRVGAIEREIEVLKEIERIRERQLSQQGERRTRGFDDAAEIAALHRDPHKRIKSIAEEEKASATRAGGLEARLFAQESRRRELTGKRISDAEVKAAERLALEKKIQHEKMAEVERRLREKLGFAPGETLDPNKVTFSHSEKGIFFTDLNKKPQTVQDFERLKEANAAAKRLESEQMFADKRVKNLRDQKRKVDEEISKSLKTSERTQAELSGVRGAQSKLGRDRIRTEFELSDDRLRLLGSLDRMYRDDERLDRLPPLKRMREEKKRENDPRIIEQREELFQGLEKHGFRRESIDSRDEVRAILEADRKRREALEDAEVEERRKQIETTNAAKDATEDFGNAAEEFAAKMIEVADKTVPMLDRAYQALELIERKIEVIDRALINNRSRI